MNHHVAKLRAIASVWLGRTLPNPSNSRRLKALEDIHRGRRAFIVANGPSLRTEDLDRLKSEVTFASNKIHLAYDETDWRPIYLC